MQRFFFNVYDGVSDIDRDGTLLPSWREAQVEAIRRCGEIVARDARRLALGEDWRMEVTSDNGLVLFRLDFLVAGAPAISAKVRPD